MYEFSVPMPFKKNLIDEIESINHKIEKSRIMTMYFALHANCSGNPGFGQSRTNHQIVDINYWLDLIKYTIDKGFDFVYLLNSPKPFMVESKFFDIQLEMLDKLLKKLSSIGCNKLRVSNPQLLRYLIQNYPEFKMYASTSFEYNQLRQYSLFFDMFPEVVEVVPSYDCNKNFELLKNLKKLNPEISIELMVNEGCIKNCPLRMFHALSVPILITNTLKNRENDFVSRFFHTLCRNKSGSIFDNICNPTLIYPWELIEYSKIGIYKFKLVGRNSTSFKETGNKEIYEIYLKGVDSYKKIENESYGNLNNRCRNVKIKIKDVKPYLPDIKYFQKNGHLCASICGVKCNYCAKCAQEMERNVNIDLTD